jgi:hypothetical protein
MLFGLDANAWVTIIVQVIVLIVGLIGALWAYTKFVLERGLLPPVQFTVEATTVGSSAGATLIEILVHLKNVGSATLVARNIRLDIRYNGNDDELTVFDDPGDPRFGRAVFAHSLRKELASRANSEPVARATGDGTRGFLVLRHHTFVQPGVDQVYTFATSLPESSRYLLVWASFEYEPRPHSIQSVILTTSRRLGLIQYSLQHATEPHTIERVFRIEGPS